MEIILKQDLKGLGFKNDIVKVKNGYGRNFLIPQRIAVLATESNKKMQAEEIKQSSFKEQKLRTAATELAAKFADISVKVGAKAGESGKIFGSVTNIQLAEALKKAGYEVERKNIEMNEEGIKALGTYTAKIRLFKEVSATINFEVIAE
ncbi:MAG: 50S ribosomal protein L9 [Bacteroidia bacterium]|jgi:large subunit ribosomal protein L9|nr:50S ribosomal protein L9 [Bacteroidia bacterium]